MNEDDDLMTSQDYLYLASVYALLSRLWIEEVDMHQLEELNEADLKSSFEAMGGSIPPANEASIEALAVDYCQLLVGPKDHVSPVQSVHESGKFHGPAAISMKRYFETLPTFNTTASIPDHIGVQLAFMTELFIQASGADHPEAYEDIASRFAIEHIAWSKKLFDQVESKAQTDFYRTLAGMSREFLNFESEEEE